MQFSSVNCAQITRHQLQSTAVCCENLVYDIFRWHFLSHAVVFDLFFHFDLLLPPFTFTYTLNGMFGLSLAHWIRLVCECAGKFEHNVTASLLKLKNVVKLYFLCTCILNCYALTSIFFIPFSVVSFMFRRSFYFNFCFVFLYSIFYLILSHSFIY